MIILERSKQHVLRQNFNRTDFLSLRRFGIRESAITVQECFVEFVSGPRRQSWWPSLSWCYFCTWAWPARLRGDYIKGPGGIVVRWYCTSLSIWRSGFDKPL